MLKILLQYKLTIVMMNCKCGNRSLFFEKTTRVGIFRVFKCDAEKTKKRGKCDFFHSEKIRDFVNSDPVQIIKTTLQETSKEVNPRENYMTNLNKYIKLCKNTSHLPREYYTGYIANMNYILKRLHMPLYFEDNESIESLEIRIKANVCVEYIRPTNIFPIKLTEYPLELAVPKKVKHIKKRKIKTEVKIKKIDLKDFIDNEEKPIPEEEAETKSIYSDSDSESEAPVDEKDNTFDVDECDSGQEDEFDDTGAFSD
tara:strand:- start:11714 stop:12481 length:768 start_codon:yes stop_codon:yes gene_type:complete